MQRGGHYILERPVDAKSEAYALPSSQRGNVLVAWACMGAVPMGMVHATSSAWRHGPRNLAIAFLQHRRMPPGSREQPSPPQRPHDAEQQVLLRRMPREHHEGIEGDVNCFASTSRRQASTFDLII